MPKLRTLKELRRFLGMCNYYRMFCHWYAMLAELLTPLTRKNVRYIFGEEQREAFSNLKSLLTESPVLK